MYLKREAPGYPGALIDRTRFEKETPPWFVDSTNANASDAAGYGRDPDAPFATLAYLWTNASTLGVAAGDVVILMPDHNEGLADAQIDFDVAGVTVMGHPNAIGSRVPIIDFDHANAEIELGANNCKLKNVKLRPSITGVKVGIDIESGVTGCVIEDVEFMMGEDGSGTDEFIKAIHLTSGNHQTVMRNVKILAHASAAQATHGIHVDAASNELVFENVIIDGPYATNGILEDAAGKNHVVVDCAVEVTGTDDGFHASSTFAKRANNEFGAVTDDSPITTIGSSVDGTTTDTLHGKIGTDTELADRSLYDQLNGSGPAAAATPAVAANDVSLYAQTSYTQFCIEQCVEKSDGAVLNGDDDIFTVSGGPVLAQIYGEVTTIVGGAANGKLTLTTTTPSATVDLNAGAVAIDNDAAGTMYYNVGATSVFTPVTANMVLLDPVTVEPTWLYLSPGTVKFNSSAAQSGVIKWMMRYRPLSPSSRVVAAA